MFSYPELIVFSIVTFVIGFLIEKVFHYRNLWIKSKGTVSWIMPSNDPNNWVIEKTFYYSDSDVATYAVVDKDTKAHVANDFKTEEDARLYIKYKLDDF